MSDKCITFPMNNHQAQVVPTESKLQTLLAEQLRQLAAHMAKRPGLENLNLRARWVDAKDQINLEIGIIEGQLHSRWKQVPLPGGQTAPVEPTTRAPRKTWDHHMGPLKTPQQRLETIMSKACALLVRIRNAEDNESFVRLTDQLNTLRNHLKRFCLQEMLDLPEFPANLPNPFSKKGGKAA